MEPVKAVRTAVNRSEVSGTTEFNDGAKLYWSEGYNDAILIHADGTREEIPADAKAIEAHKYAGLIWNGVGLQEMATREEEIEYEMISGNMSREQAETNIDELDELDNQV